MIWALVYHYLGFLGFPLGAVCTYLGLFLGGVWVV